MRIRILTIVAIVLSTTVVAFAEDVNPPPGFIPGQDSDAAPGAATPRFLPYQDTTPRQDVFPDQNQTYQAPANPYTPYGPPAGQVLPGPVLFPPDVTPFPRVWFGAEALYWWTKDSPLPVPLVTDGGGSVLIGNQDISFPGRGGARLNFGFSLDAEQTWAFEAGYFFLASTSVSQSVFSDGSPGSAQLNFPFIDSTTSQPSSSPISNPGSWAGDATVTVQTFLQGADANLLKNLYNVSGVRFDMLGGFRWLNLQERLTFTTDSPDLPPVGPDLFHTFDRFSTNNNFYGAQLGARVSYDNSRLFMNAMGKLALGATVENVGINGGTFSNVNGPFMSAPGGYLTQPSNIGNYSRSQFAVIPEVNLNFGIHMTPWASFVVGYSFLYVSSVARPGDQIDPVINPNTSPAIGGNFSGASASHPAVNIRDTDFWAQGLNFSLQFRY